MFVLQSRIALSEQLKKGKELTQKVGSTIYETDNSEDSDEEQIEVSEHVTDPDNPWLAERKEFTDFMNDYNNFIQNNNKTSDNNSQNENIQHKDSILTEEKNINTATNEPANFKEVHTINEFKNKNKVKHITVHDLSKFSDEDSDVEILKIASPKSKVCSTSDVEPEFKINEVNETIEINSTTPQKSYNNEVIHSAVGTWVISSNNIEKIKSKKKKVHRDVENTFKNVEAELKNKIDKSLNNLNKIQLKQSSKIKSFKHKKEDNDYLKMNKKRVKTEFNEPLLEDNKILNTAPVANIIDNPGPSNVIAEISKKQVQNIDPTEFLKVTQTNLETEEMDQVEDHLDDKDENEQEKLIAEAFADDDIINEFKYL